VTLWLIVKFVEIRKNSLTLILGGRIFMHF